MLAVCLLREALYQPLKLLSSKRRHSRGFPWPLCSDHPDSVLLAAGLGALCDARVVSGCTAQACGGGLTTQVPAFAGWSLMSAQPSPACCCPPALTIPHPATCSFEQQQRPVFGWPAQAPQPPTGAAQAGFPPTPGYDGAAGYPPAPGQQA